MIMSTLHHITPDERHGEALAFRSMAINLVEHGDAAVFGAAGGAVGAAALFWSSARRSAPARWAARAAGRAADGAPRT